MFRILLLPVVTLAFGWFMGGGPVEIESGNLASYPEHLTGAFTGGFNEETCHSCHFDYEVNPNEGDLSISGIDKSIAGGEVAEFKIKVGREELGRAGFQLSVRFEDGSQAGQLKIEESNRLTYTRSVPDSLQYIQHSEKGSEPDGADKSSWTVRWKAPEPGAGTVIFNIAANAANGDQSEFGDYIFTEEKKLDF